MCTLNEAKLITMCIFLHFVEQLYNEMIDCATEDRAYYSAHFVSSQVEFVEGQPPNVKDLIRLVKYWRKTCIEDKISGTARLPSSYPLELITIACWQKAGKPSFDIRAGFKAVLQRLANNSDISFVWYKYYDKATAERGIKRMESKRFVLVSVQGKLLERPRRGQDAHIKVLGVHCTFLYLPGGQNCLRVLKSRMTTCGIITAAFTAMSKNRSRKVRQQPFASQILCYSFFLYGNDEQH